MAAIKSTGRSASVAFAPEAHFLAAGTMAGAIDLSFSSSANLEIFKLDFQSDDPELPVVGECPSSERFNRLSWGNTGAGSYDYSLGLIAGGLVDGSISVWNPATLISSEEIEGALIARLQKHTGPVRGLEFNANSPNFLPSGWRAMYLGFDKSYDTNSFSNTEGVIAMAWCPNDSSFLLTCAKDNRTLCWDTVSGEDTWSSINIFI